MESKALQELIKTIFDDEKTRNEFESNPENVISRFNLTNEEKKAVLNTHAKLGLITSNSQQLEAILDPTIIWSKHTP